MKRAAVIIGVDETGNLQKLQAAAASARQVAKWAESQQFGAIKVITDEAEEVKVAKIKEAIKVIVDAGTFEQLLVYFSGHGANVRQDEYWLLSGAPDDTNEAVNVSGSAYLARFVGIPHVVLVSDACRTAAASLQAQLVTGSEIFPNPVVRSKKARVDVFYATLIGKPALEIEDSKAANSYKSIYSAALLDGLYGHAVEAVEKVDEAGAPIEFVRPLPLEDYLEAEVPRRLQAAAISITAFQQPDADINSREKEKPWLARLAPPPDRLPDRGPIPPPPPPVLPTLPHSEPEMAYFARRIAVFGDRVDPDIARVAADVVAKEAEERASPFGPGHFETRCGFKVRGARFVEAYLPRSPFSLLMGEPPTDSFHVPGEKEQVATNPKSIMLAFDNGKSTILPAIPEFVTGLTVKEGELVDVVYEPADTSPRWPEYQSRADEMRQVRGRIAAAAQFGVFRLEGENVFHLARKMQQMKALDPTLALYAAYAFDSLQETDRINEMQKYLYDDLHLRLFDVALLAEALDGRNPIKEADVFPSIPLLSQGWALLSAHRVKQPLLRPLSRFLESSLWTLFTPKGNDFLKQAWQSGDIH